MIVPKRGEVELDGVKLGGMRPVEEGGVEEGLEGVENHQTKLLHIWKTHVFVHVFRNESEPRSAEISMCFFGASFS